MAKYKNILIGGSGFIGSELARKLEDAGESFLSLSKDISDKFSKDRQIILNIENKEKLKSVLKGAADVFILFGQTRPGIDYDRELDKLRETLGCLDNKSVKKVFFLSSSLTYGDTIRLAKEGDVLNPIDNYSRFKTECEKIVLEEARKKGFLAAIMRLSNVYGTPQNRGFISLVLNKVLERSEEKISLNGDGEQKRDYILVDDVIEAILTVRKKIKKTDTINISTGKSYSLKELLEIIFGITGYRLEYVLQNNEVVEAKNNQISNQKLVRTYGFAPRYHLKKGLKTTWERYKESNNRVLILGGEGFIGRNLAEYLENEGYKCFSVGVEKSVFDIRQDEFISKNPYKESLDNKCRYIVHLIDNKINQEDFLEEEKKMVRNLNLSDSNHLIVFSSAVIYANPQSEYAQRKIKLENFYTEFCQKINCRLTILRPFNTYGYYQFPNRQGSLVANIFFNYLDGKETEINDMEAKRDFMYVYDIAKTVHYVISDSKTGTFDVATGKSTSIGELLEIMQKKVIKDKISIVDKKIKENIKCPQAKNILTFDDNFVSLKDGLRKTWDFYKKNYNFFKD